MIGGATGVLGSTTATVASCSTIGVSIVDFTGTAVGTVVATATDVDSSVADGSVAASTFTRSGIEVFAPLWVHADNTMLNSTNIHQGRTKIFLKTIPSFNHIVILMVKCYMLLTAWYNPRRPSPRNRGFGMPIEVHVEDVVRLRKPHPCGGYEWSVVRIGADIGIKCKTCGRRVLLPRRDFEKRLKTFVRPES